MGFDAKMTCNYWQRRGVIITREEDWMKAHEGHDVQLVPYEGQQPPSYTLEKLRCMDCKASYIRIKDNDKDKI